MKKYIFFDDAIIYYNYKGNAFVAKSNKNINILNTYIKSHVRLSDGRCGEVIMINKHMLSRPLIRCSSHYIDLSKEPDVVYIEDII